MKEQNIPTFGTTSDQIDLAEDREQFDALLEKLGIRRPKGKAVWSVEEGIAEANALCYPVLVRPSFVLGGQGMEITYSEEEVLHYLTDAFEKDRKNPILIDKYLMGRELEVDAISDGEDILIPGIMEHLERAGVHSGDSITMYPSRNVSDKIKQDILDYTKRIAKAIGIKGMINIQFISYNEELYVIEVNPRASRTVPYISKVSGVPIVAIATQVMLGEKLADIGYGTGIYEEAKLISVKVPVFSTQKLPNVEVSLGPEMKSTGEVLGIGTNYEEALYKGFMASNMFTSRKGRTIMATVKDSDKAEFLAIAKELHALGFEFVATSGTAKMLSENGIPAREVNRIGQESPNLLDLIVNKEVQLLVNTPTKGNDSKRDGFILRRAAIERNIDVMTSLDTLNALLSFEKNAYTPSALEIFNIVTAF